MSVRTKLQKKNQFFLNFQIIDIIDIFYSNNLYKNKQIFNIFCFEMLYFFYFMFTTPLWRGQMFVDIFSVIFET